MPASVQRLKVAPAAERGEAPSSPAQPGRTRRWLAGIAREPFFQFLLLGLLIWSGAEYWSADRDRHIIDLGLPERQRIAETYAQQFGQLPNAEQLKGLIDRYIREEIYWREGLALNLDQNDEIVRRRIVQKYEFLQTDLSVTEAPTEQALERWLEHHKQRYLTPEQVGFSHVYFSPDRDGEEAAKARAVKALQQLGTSHITRAPAAGDRFPGPTDISALASEEAARLFGQSQLTDALFKLPTGQWSGPFRSGYGWHLVYLTSRAASTSPPYAHVQPRVLADYQDEQRHLSNARHFEQLRAKYTVRDERH